MEPTARAARQSWVMAKVTAIATRKCITEYEPVFRARRMGSVAIENYLHVGESERCRKGAKAKTFADGEGGAPGDRRGGPAWGSPPPSGASGPDPE
ncbi:MAG: hypothetical protein BroJett013_15830 [Alphaproteobacteria bacterium]|nr:MAG: hypothetical protein BroJett013_15830 [Alphaproteobacteria bacterium]